MKKYGKKVALRASRPVAATAPSWTGQLWAWFWPEAWSLGNLGWRSWKMGWWRND